MPVISRFYGIVVQMFFREERQHHLPHIHIMYNEYNSVYDFNGNKLEGEMGGTSMYITPKILKARALEEYRIELEYETGEIKIYDMTELLNSCKIYHNLKDKEKFKKLKIFGLSLQWEDGEDIAPELLYENSILKNEKKEQI